jgi:hypothetical protein
MAHPSRGLPYLGGRPMQILWTKTLTLCLDYVILANKKSMNHRLIIYIYVIEAKPIWYV